MTPEQLKELFNANAIVIVFAWGLLCKYVPMLKAIPNILIPWLGALGYIFTKLLIPDAHAADSVVTTGNVSPIPALIGVIIGGFTNAVWARQLYEGFARGVIERWLAKPKKAHA